MKEAAQPAIFITHASPALLGRPSEPLLSPADDEKDDNPSSIGLGAIGEKPDAKLAQLTSSATMTVTTTTRTISHALLTTKSLAAARPKCVRKVGVFLSIPSILIIT